MKSSDRPFLQVIRRLEVRLSAPVPERIRILRELEADLDDLYGHLRARGRSHEDAFRSAVEALVPDGEVADALDRLHRPAWSRLTARIDPTLLHFVERSAVVLSATGTLILSILGLRSAQLLADPSPFLLPVLVLSTVVVGQVGWRLLRIVLHLEVPGDGSSCTSLLATGGLTLALAVAGVLVDALVFATAAAADPEAAGARLLSFLMRESSLLATGLTTMLVAGLAWFLIAQWSSALHDALDRIVGGRAASSAPPSHDAPSLRPEWRRT